MKFVYVILMYFLGCKANFSPLIEIEQGVLRGLIKKDYNGRDFYSFLSVPYARKPVGKLRFMIPVSPSKWEGVLNATEDMPICLQKNFQGELLGQEDCLYLNVHTPELITKDLKPVMVYIHGGGFVEGNGRIDMLGPDFLVGEDIVLVTINYRLNLFGFLNFANPEVGVFGNMGLKDQNMALRWVQKNIEKFGGDPSSVTIFGESAGAFSVHFHVLSPMSQGLFHKAIAQSGTVLNSWSTAGQRDTGVLAAKFLGYEGKSEMGMLPFLQEASIDDIFKVHENESVIFSLNKPCFRCPIVENVEDYLSFLPKSPAALVASKKFEKIPFIIGFTNEEAIIFDTVSFMTKQRPAELSFDDMIPKDFNILEDDKAKSKLIEKIKNFYNLKDDDDEDRSNVLKFIGDAYFYWGAVKSAEAHLKASHENVYLYVFSADTELNYAKRLHPVTAKYPGAGHVDDLGYFFKTLLTPDIKPNSVEEQTVKRVVKLWSNFAKYGNPTPKFEELNVIWEPVQGGAFNYLEIANEGLKTGVNPFAERVAFWDGLEAEYKKGKPVHTEL